MMGRQQPASWRSLNLSLRLLGPGSLGSSKGRGGRHRRHGGHCHGATGDGRDCVGIGQRTLGVQALLRADAAQSRVSGRLRQGLRVGEAVRGVQRGLRRARVVGDEVQVLAGRGGDAEGLFHQTVGLVAVAVGAVIGAAIASIAVARAGMMMVMMMMTAVARHMRIRTHAVGIRVSATILVRRLCAVGRPRARARTPISSMSTGSPVCCCCSGGGGGGGRGGGGGSGPTAMAPPFPLHLAICQETAAYPARAPALAIGPAAHAGLALVPHKHTAGADGLALLLGQPPLDAREQTETAGLEEDDGIARRADEPVVGFHCRTGLCGSNNSGGGGGGSGSNSGSNNNGGS